VPFVLRLQGREEGLFINCFNEFAAA